MSDNRIFSYTKRDYEGSRQEGISQIPSLSGNKWTDLNATDPGIIILDYVHALVDMLNYYQDHQALETFITTAKERKNIFRLAKQLSYEVRSAKGATVEVVFSVTTPYNRTIKIPKYTSMSTYEGIRYLTSEDAYLTAGNTYVVVPCTQGTLYIDTYQGRGTSSKVDNNAEDQFVTLTSNNIDIDSIKIVDSLGREWKRVDYLVFSTEVDRVYQLDLNPDDSVTIKFGDGKRGIYPEDTDILTIEYVVTNGESGKIKANELNILDSLVYDNDEYIEFTITNNLASTGGSSIQSSKEIRDLAPGVIKAQNRALTLTDFESLAKIIDGVADAKAYDRNTLPDLCLYHEVKVLIVPKDPDGNNELLQEKVYKSLYNKMVPPTNLQVLTPSKVKIDINVSILKLNINIDGGIQYSIENAIRNYFYNKSGSVGEPFYPSDLYQVIYTVEGVRSILSLSASVEGVEYRDVLNIPPLSVATLGSINISVT